METYESKMNFSKKRLEESKYITIQSVIGFNHKDFTIRIREELEFLGLEQTEFGKSLYIGEDRFRRLLLNKVNYTSDEIFRISKRLGFL
jgi:hypothetical protein